MDPPASWRHVDVRHINVQNIQHPIAIVYTIVKRFETFDNPQDTIRRYLPRQTPQLRIGNKFNDFPSACVGRDFLL
jgi:hypothetical protein